MEIRYESIRKEAVKDPKFRRKWGIKKAVMLQCCKKCKYCHRKFSHYIKPILHHSKMNKELEKYQNIKESETWKAQKALIEYYKSLKDISLICSKCHGGVHSVNQYYQTKLF